MRISDYGYENGEFWIRFQGEAGRSYQAESSVDLVKWKSAGEKVLGQDNAPSEMRFSGTTNSRQFIRVRNME